MAKQTIEYREGIAVKEQASFRSYSSYKESFDDYVQFIEGSPRYRQALEQVSDPNAYVKALQSAGYATDPAYADKVLGIMQRDVMISSIEQLKNPESETLIWWGELTEEVMADMLSIGASGLMTYQKALSTTGHNISNVNTEGYTRQRVELDARNPSGSGQGFFGQGVEVDAVRRMYDGFLTTTLQDNTSRESELDTFHQFIGFHQNTLLMLHPHVAHHLSPHKSQTLT